MNEYIKLSDNANRVVLHISESADYKMKSLVQSCGTEVGWHMIAGRTHDGFKITDVLVYPQIVGSTTVNTEQEAYENWLMDLPDEQFRFLRGHGHSHVRMDAFPSAVDIQHQCGIVDSLKGDDFYIFMILNKLGESWVMIVDMKNGCLYTPAVVNIVIDSPIVEFIKDAKSKICERNVKL